MIYTIYVNASRRVHFSVLTKEDYYKIFHQSVNRTVAGLYAINEGVELLQAAPFV